MYVSEIYAVGIFVTFPKWLKNVKSRSKIAFFFQMSAILKFHFQKKKTITCFWSKLSKLHTHTQKTQLILHVTTTFSLKQGEIEQTVYPFRTP